jgi:hypothetical protein
MGLTCDEIITTSVKHVIEEGRGQKESLVGTSAGCFHQFAQAPSVKLLRPHEADDGVQLSAMPSWQAGKLASWTQQRSGRMSSTNLLG